MSPDESSPQPEDRVPQGSPEPGPGREPEPESTPAQIAEPVAAAEQAEPADAPPSATQAQEMAPPQAMPMPMAMPVDPNAVSGPTAILGTAPDPAEPDPAASDPAAPPLPYPPNAPVPPFGGAAAAAQYAGFARPPGTPQPGMPVPPPYPLPYPPTGYPAPTYPVPTYPAPTYPAPQYPYAAYGQQPMPGAPYPGQWPRYVPPQMGPPPRDRRAGTIGGIVAAIIVVGAVVVAIAVSGSRNSPSLGAAPSQSGAPQATNPAGLFPTGLPTNLPTDLPTNIVTVSPSPFAFSLPTSAGPLNQVTGSQAQTLEAPMQTVVTAEQQSLGGTLQLGAYQDSSASPAVDAVVAANAVTQLPSLESVVTTGDYQTFIDEAVTGAHMVDTTTPQSYTGAMTCGGVQESTGLVPECIWLDQQTFGIVTFSPVANTSAENWNVAIVDGPKLRQAIDY